jgi:hypothetical protein
MFFPLTTDPVPGADVVPTGVPVAIVAVVGVVPVGVDGGAVLVHPAIARAITTRTISRNVLSRIFIFISPD